MLSSVPIHLNLQASICLPVISEYRASAIQRAGHDRAREVVAPGRHQNHLQAVNI